MIKLTTLTLGLFCLISLSFAADRLSTSTIKIGTKSYEVSLPNNYKLELVNDQLSRPRLFSFARNKDLFIGSRSGTIYHLKPPYTDVYAELKFGGYPHSIAFRYSGDKTEVFVAETDGLYKATYKNKDFDLIRQDFKLISELPGGSGHTSRTVAVGPDQAVYIALGITGNCSDEYLDDSYRFADRRGGVFILDESGETAELKPFATGLRNPVGFDWHPETNDLYASNNGPDHLGYEEPREYFSLLEADSFHGMPWFQLIDGKIERDNCIKRKPPMPIDSVVPPIASFDARSAPMGVTFVHDSGLDSNYSGDAIVAIHGSWGTKPSGGFLGSPASRRHPKLVRVEFEDGKATGTHDFITGFQLENGSRWARPLGVDIGPDGALYFTSDANNEGLYKLSPK